MKGSSDTSVHFAMTIIGMDRPGIVAGDVEVLFSPGCNIEDSSSTLLGGEFAMILIVSHEKPFSKSRLMENFKVFSEAMHLSCFCQASDQAQSPPPVTIRRAMLGISVRLRPARNRHS